MRTLLARALRRFVAPRLSPRARLWCEYRSFLIDGSAEPELRHLHRFTRRGGTAVDVGANRGHYACRMSQLFDRVHAFEIDPGLTSDLACLAPGRVEVHNVGLSASAGRASFFVPFRGDGMRLHGWGSLHADNCPDADHVTETQVELQPLDDFALADVALIKIDVEGHELQVLQGARQTLARWRPVVLVEIKPRNRAAIARFFDELGYTGHQLRELTGIQGAEENFIYRPSPPARR